MQGMPTITSRELETLKNITQFHEQVQNIQVIIEKIEKYLALLLEFNTKRNLIAQSTIHNIWSRHVIDCAQLVQYIPKDDYEYIVDLGSGAGLPGIIIAILLPRAKVILVEKSNIKVSFLQSIIEKMKLHNVSIIAGVIDKESLLKNISLLKSKSRVYFVTRAFTSTIKLFDLLSLVIEKYQFTLIALKGRSSDTKEVGIQINKRIKIERYIYSSITGDGFVLCLSSG